MIWMFSSLIILEKRNNGIDFFFLIANIPIQELISILYAYKHILVQVFDFVFVIFFYDILISSELECDIVNYDS